MKKVNIGLDIGIASVGWAIVNDEEFEIIDAGSRLFNEANDTNAGAAASIRRDYRGRRRNLRRDSLRRNELKKMFVEKGWIKKPEDFNYIQPTNKNVYELRLKALSNPVTPNEFMLICSNWLKHRGVFNLKDEAIEEAKKNNKNDSDLNLEEIENFEKNLEANNDNLLKACEIQLINLKNKGSVKGSHNKLSHDKYLEEINETLEIQKQYGLIDDEFIEKYLNIFNRRRQYYEGPGQNSPFGWNGNQEEFYDRLLGFDSYNPTEVRAPKFGLYTNLFNILNDLNNITINSGNREETKLNRKEKELIVNSIFNTKGKPSNLTLNKLSKLINIPEGDISGYRIDKNDKAQFTTFEILNKINKFLTKDNITIDWLNLEHADLIDDLSLIMTKGQSYDYRQKEIEKCLNKYNINQSELIASKLANISLNGSHALSNKTIKSVLEEMWDKPHSSQIIFTARKIRPQYQFHINSNTKYIPISIQQIQEMYISPVAKRSFIQALKVLKQIQKYCDGNYEINGVYIELAREKNSEDEKNFIKLQQKNNEKLNKEIKNITDIQNPDSEINSHTKRKLRLLIEQSGKCAYCFQQLHWDDVKNKPHFTEVDHIIPESISFSTNSDNLVLVHQEENHAKGNDTPFRYFTSPKNGFSWEAWSTKVKNELYNDFLKNNKNSKKYIKRKIDHLLDETNFDNTENLRGFIERNLNDTRTSTTAIKEYLEECRRLKIFDFKIKTINGQFTDFIKKYYFDLPRKDRDYFEHHAIDAIAIAYSDWARKHRLERHQWSHHKNEIINYDFRFSRMSNHNLNKQFTDETLYSFRKNENEEFVKIQKIDIFTTDPNKIKKLDQLLNKDSDKVLMSKADPFTFQHLQKIWKEYPIDMDYIDNEKNLKVRNPFIYYRDVLGHKIIKRQNKKGLDDPNINPLIKKLKYEDDKIGKSFLDVTHKYPLTKENKKIAFKSCKPIRIDFWRNKYTNAIRMLMLNITDIKKSINDYEIIINKPQYENHKMINNITNDYELIDSVFPGDVIEFEQNNKKYLSIVVVGKANKLEIKHLHRNRIKTATIRNPQPDKSRIYLPLLSIENINRKNFDILGIKSSQYMLEF